MVPENIISFLLLSVIAVSCRQEQEKKDSVNLKAGIIHVESSFMNDLNSKGAAFAFYLYASDDAVIKRENDTLIIGKAAIKDYYSATFYQNATAEWEPDFINVSDDGNLAYTYGRYIWNFRDSTGIVTSFKGVFHTVWKRMSDGSWKYVWD